MGVIALGSFGPNGEVKFEADFNDTNRRITRIRCINQGSGSARVTLLEPAGNTIVAQTVFLPNSTTQFNVSGQQVIVGPEGVDIPYNTRIQYPV